MSTQKNLRKSKNRVALSNKSSYNKDTNKCSGDLKMQAKQAYNRFTTNLINNTTNFINNNFDFNIDSNKQLQIKQMPLMQLELFAEQSFQKKSSVIITMLNDERFQGKFISRVNQNKYVFKVSDAFFEIVTLDRIKSINLV